MSVSPDSNIGPSSCNENQDQQPKLSAEDLIKGDSAGLAAIIQALGIQSCKTATVAGASIFPPYAIGGQASIGCGQIAILAGEMDAAQKVIQCSMYNLSMSKNTSAVQNCTINVSFSDNTRVSNCLISITQKSGMEVYNYSQMTSEMKQKITSNVTTAMDGFIKSIQTQTEKGLFPKSDGQRVVESMTQNLNNMIENDAITNIVQEQIETYTNTGVINFSLDGTQIVGNVNQNGPNFPCITITQGFVMQLLSQSIMTASLDQLMEGTAKAELKLTLENAQTQDLQGVPPFSFGMVAVVVAIAIVALVLLFAKKPGGDQQGGGSESVLAGKVGIIFGSILLVIGAALFLTGLVLKLQKKTNAILCYLLMVGGAILMIVAIVMIVKARSQQLRFEQNLSIAKTDASKK